MPSDVTFASNQSSINPRFNATLDDVAGVLNRYDQSIVDVVGHADSDGADEYNLNLSRQRASSVAQYLVSRNVLADRLYVDGRGESAPIASNDTAAGKALNRSTNFMLDDVIDPAETRTWVTNMLAAIRPGPARAGKKRPMIDAW